MKLNVHVMFPNRNFGIILGGKYMFTVFMLKEVCFSDIPLYKVVFPVTHTIPSPSAGSQSVGALSPDLSFTLFHSLSLPLSLAQSRCCLSYTGCSVFQIRSDSTKELRFLTII